MHPSAADCTDDCIDEALDDVPLAVGEGSV